MSYDNAVFDEVDRLSFKLVLYITVLKIVVIWIGLLEESFPEHPVFLYLVLTKIIAG